MFINKKLFDRKNGEIRECMDCKKSFHTFKPLNRCPTCSYERVKKRTKERIEEGTLIPLEHKKPYPFSTSTDEAGKRFRKIQKELGKCNTREERRAFYQHQLDEAERLGIMNWIWDRRDEETLRGNTNKSKTRIEKDIPDTRYMSWDDFERGGWGEPEDS